MTRLSSYEEFRQLAEHPRHRDVPTIFLLEVIETEEQEEGHLSYYPQYKVRTYSRAYATTLEEAERLMHQDFLYRKDKGDGRLDAGCLLLLHLGATNKHDAFQGGISLTAHV